MKKKKKMIRQKKNKTGTYWQGTTHVPTNIQQEDLVRVAETKRQMLLAVLWDRVWHTTQELVTKVGHRFGASLLLLRKEGWRVLTTDKGYCLQSRLRGPGEGSKVRLYISFASAKALCSGDITEEVFAAANEAVGD